MVQIEPLGRLSASLNVFGIFEAQFKLFSFQLIRSSRFPHLLVLFSSKRYWFLKLWIFLLISSIGIFISSLMLWIEEILSSRSLYSRKPLCQRHSFISYRVMRSFVSCRVQLYFDIFLVALLVLIMMNLFKIHEGKKFHVFSHFNSCYFSLICYFREFFFSLFDNFFSSFSFLAQKKHFFIETFYINSLISLVLIFLRFSTRFLLYFLI